MDELQRSNQESSLDHTSQPLSPVLRVLYKRRHRLIQLQLFYRRPRELQRRTGRRLPRLTLGAHPVDKYDASPLQGPERGLGGARRATLKRPGTSGVETQRAAGRSTADRKAALDAQGFRAAG